MNLPAYAEQVLSGANTFALSYAAKNVTASRLQLGFPGTFSFIDPNQYLQLITMHGMIMVIYLLTALFLGGFGN
jgi:heme/copper-type cytochrome/quinol oxidase subunit 1